MTLTIDDIEQIVEGIENFIIGCGRGSEEVRDIWQPYIDKLNALKASIITARGICPHGNEVDMCNDEDCWLRARR